MILTNVLLSVCFSLIANFTNSVPVPGDEVPTCIEDLKEFSVGSPFWPADADLAHHRGSVFSVQHGVVRFFVCSDAFSHLQDRRLVPRFRGLPSLSSNEVVQLAERTVRSLARRGDPLTGLQPQLRRLEESPGVPVPFYEVRWPNPKRGGDSPAFLEIDARTGRIVLVHLLDRAFYDLAFSWEMRNRVCIPDSPEQEAYRRVRTAAKRSLPCPSANQVLRAIESWLRLCRGIGVDQGSISNLLAVKWESACIYTNPWIAPTAVVCAVAFTNGGWFSTIGDVAFAHFAPDACYVNDWRDRSWEEWFVFEGRINGRWRDLARKLEVKLVVNLGIPQSLLMAYSPQLRNEEPELGGTGIRRVLVEWTNGESQRMERRDGAALVWENNLGFAAEFDLESSELKAFRLRDPRLIEALREAQSRANRK